MKLIVYTDGSVANEGLGLRYSFIGCSVQTEQGAEIESLSQYIGSFDSNRTEYIAAREGLKLAMKLGALVVELRSDSLNLVNTFNGIQTHKTNASNYEKIILEIREAARFLNKFSVVHVPRENNKRANFLSHHAYSKAPTHVKHEMGAIFSSLTASRKWVDFIEPKTMEEAERRRLEQMNYVKSLQEKIRRDRIAFNKGETSREMYPTERHATLNELKTATTDLRMINEWLRTERNAINTFQTMEFDIPPFEEANATSLVRAALVLFRRLAREGLVSYSQEEQGLVDAMREHDRKYGAVITRVS